MLTEGGSHRSLLCEEIKTSMELLDKVKSMTFILRRLYVLVTKKSKGKIPRDAFFVPLFLEHFP